MAQEARDARRPWKHRRDLAELCRPLIERSPQPMAAVEGDTHIVRYANPAFCRLFGEGERDPVGRRFEEAMPEGMAGGCSELIDRVFANPISAGMADLGSPPEVVEVSYAHLACSMWAILGLGEQPVGVMVQVADLTKTDTFLKEAAAMNEVLLLSALRQHELREGSEQSIEQLTAEIIEGKEAQEALRRIAAAFEMRVRERTGDLEKANRELQGFAYSMAHDLRAPLRAIISTSSILLEEARENLTESHATLLDRQSINASKLARLIDDLLEFARLSQQPFKRKPVDISAIAKDLATALPVGFPDRLLDVVIEENLVAEADHAAIRIVLQNLIENAAKFSPGGGKISIGRQEEGEGAFFVRDEGIGFDMNHNHRMFLPFERLVSENEFAGNGIGLANVKRIVERHGGTVWAEALKGTGATFFFTLR